MMTMSNENEMGGAVIGAHAPDFVEISVTPSGGPKRRLVVKAWQEAYKDRTDSRQALKRTAVRFTIFKHPDSVEAAGGEAALASPTEPVDCYITLDQFQRIVEAVIPPWQMRRVLGLQPGILG